MFAFNAVIRIHLYPNFLWVGYLKKNFKLNFRLTGYADPSREQNDSRQNREVVGTSRRPFQTDGKVSTIAGH